jgi:hypothetical protein
VPKGSDKRTPISHKPFGKVFGIKDTDGRPRYLLGAIEKSDEPARAVENPAPKQTLQSTAGCSHDAVIRVYDDAANVIETHEHKGRFQGAVN